MSIFQTFLSNNILSFAWKFVIDFTHILYLRYRKNLKTIGQDFFFYKHLIKMLTSNSFKKCLQKIIGWTNLYETWILIENIFRIFR